MACKVIFTDGISSRNTIYESIHSIHLVLHASLSFFALGDVFMESITLSNNRCHFGENLKNLAISPMHDSVFLNACILHAATIDKFS